MAAFQSIRVQLIAAVSLVALLALFASGEQAWHAARLRAAATAALQTNANADLWLSAAGAWGVERGLTNTALNEEAPASGEQLARIGALRRDADHAADAALTDLRQRGIEVAGVETLQRLRQELARAREQADAALKLRVSQRPRSLLEGWLPAMTGVIEQSQAIRVAAGRLDETTGGVLARLQQLKQDSWVMREFAGRERSLLGGIIASGQPITASQLRDLGRFRDRVEQAWSDIGSLLKAGRLPESLRLAADQLSDDYFNRFETLRAEVYKAGMSGGGYPVDASHWVEAASKGIDKMLALARSAGDAAGAAATRSAAQQQRAFWVALALLAGCLLITLCASFVVIRRVCRPLAALTDVTGRLTLGELEAAIPFQGRHDELGRLARSVATLRDGMRDKRALEKQQAELAALRRAEQDAARLRAEQETAMAQAAVEVIGGALHKLAERDLTTDLEQVLPGRYDGIRQDLRRALAELRSALLEVVDHVGNMRSGTSEIADSAAELARRSEMQAAGLENSTSVLKRLAGTIRETAEGAMTVSVAIKKTQFEAQSSGEIVRKAVDAMGAIQASSRKIGERTGIIDELAFQTNLLALNAAVEAARAGDLGRGFAVVAAEVRALAQRSADAAREIKGLISASGSQVERGVQLVGEAGSALDRILGQVSEITQSVAGIAEAARAQGEGLNEFNAAVNRIEQTTMQDAAMAEENTAASRSLEREAIELEQLTRRFRLQASETALSSGRGRLPALADAGRNALTPDKRIAA